MPTKLQKKLKEKILAAFMERFPTVETIQDAKEIHYGRNSNQLPGPGYEQVIFGSYEQVSATKSAFHRLDIVVGGVTATKNGLNSQNSKWTAAGGHAEYVYRYVGTAGKGQFELVESPLNIGTFNFSPASDSFLGLEHKSLDVNPWILWGNDAVDEKTWTVGQRNSMFKSAVKDAVFSAGNDKGDKHKGGFGKDTVSFETSRDAVTVNLEKKAGFDGDARGDTFRSIENIVGSNWGDILVGNRKGNVLTGGGGRDILIGGDGKDEISGEAGDDTVYGQDGDDTLIAEGGRDTLFGGDDDDTFIIKKGHKHVIDGGDGYDTVDLRGINLQRLDAANFRNIEEIWVDDAFVAQSVFPGLQMVRVFGDAKVSFAPNSGGDWYLFGLSLGGAIELEEGASITMTMKPSLSYKSLGSLVRSQIASGELSGAYHNLAGKYGEGWSGTRHVLAQDPRDHPGDLYEALGLHYWYDEDASWVDLAHSQFMYDETDNAKRMSSRIFVQQDADSLELDWFAQVNPDLTMNLVLG